MMNEQEQAFAFAEHSKHEPYLTINSEEVPDSDKAITPEYICPECNLPLSNCDCDIDRYPTDDDDDYDYVQDDFNYDKDKQK